MICPSWQSKKGCTDKQAYCPHGKLHRCAFWVGDRYCGGQHHGKAYCTNVKAADGSYKKAKDKGKGKDKSKGKGAGSKGHKGKWY